MQPLVLPPREKPSKGGFPTSPRKVRRWLQGLGTQDPQAAARELQEGLRALNRLDLRPRRRLQLVELARPSARELLDRLAARVRAVPLPLPERTRAVFELALVLLHEIALAYCIALADQTEGGRRRGRRRTALAAERALAARGEIMLRSAEVYAPLGDAFWEVTNAVYARAEAGGAGDIRVNDGELVRGGRQRQSAAEMYQRLLLFALAQPQSLRRGEAGRVYGALETWVARTRFGHSVPGDEQGRQDTVFGVDLARDAPPVPWKLLRGREAPSVRAFDLRRLVAAIEALQERADGGAGTAAEGIDRATLTRLADEWGQRRLRRSRRVRQHEQATIEVEVGLPAVRACLAAEERPGRETPWGGSGARAALQTIERDRRHDMPQASSGYPHARAAAEPSRPAAGAQGGASAWRLEDISPTGFRLQWQGEGSSRVVVGELVALRLSGTTAAAAKWRVGVVRWMQFLDGDHFDIGVHGLSKNAAAAAARREPANRHHKRRRDAAERAEPALLLPGARALGRPVTVVLAAQVFRQGEVVELDVRGRTLRVQLGARHEGTGSIEQFEMVPAPTRGRSARPG